MSKYRIIVVLDTMKTFEIEDPNEENAKIRACNKLLSALYSGDCTVIKCEELRE